MCFCTAKQSVMKNKVKSSTATDVGGTNIWSLSIVFSKQRNLIAKQTKK